jgi:uncharacterized protein (TIGR00299 family) protein
LGGVAGDMFVAALIDAFPEYEAGAVEAARAVARVDCRRVPHRDHVMCGSRFVVDAPIDFDHSDHHHAHPHAHHGAAVDESRSTTHAHTTWREVRARIEAAELAKGVARRAIAIFEHLAEAEARVHGMPVDAVTFHEVGAVDSIADIVAAAWLIDALAPARWSVGALPLGNGLVKTAHGPLPVPAPAVVLLLEGFDVMDDGLPGERVTPTGAAILRHLACVPRTGLQRTLARSGTGFGTRRLPGKSNALRVLAFKAADVADVASAHRDLAVVTFEVDDQSAEDLAAGLQRIRSLEGVHDVMQMAALGKKGRMATHIQILVRPDTLESAVEACFRETTTIGLRTHLVQGRVLPREMSEVSVGGVSVRVKSATRPDGRTSKAEMDDSLALAGHAARVRLRRRAEEIAEEPAVVGGAS